MEASCSCSVQPCLFVQNWPRHFLVQCWENMCNVGGAFAAAGYYQKINQFKIKIAKKWCYSDDIGFFFLCNIVWSLLGNVAQCFCLCNVVRIFHVKCFLEALGHCTRFLPVQCCPKSIKTTSNRIYSWVMFSGGSWTNCTMLPRANWTTLHKVFTCAMLSQ